MNCESIGVKKKISPVVGQGGVDVGGEIGARGNFPGIGGGSYGEINGWDGSAHRTDTS